jgi:hypothetical protein
MSYIVILDFTPLNIMVPINMCTEVCIIIKCSMPLDAAYAVVFKILTDSLGFCPYNVGRDSVSRKPCF